MRGSICFMILCAVASPAWPQRAISAKAGLIHYVEGRVEIDGKRLLQHTNRFVNLAPGQTLTTHRGRVEILLNPFSFLRVAENSSIRLVSDDLLDTRVELLSGRAMLDVIALENDNAVTLQINGTDIVIRKDGLYHFSSPNLLRVYDGEARIAEAKITKGRLVDLAGTLEPAKFDRDEIDDLYRWNTRRARAIERTNGTPFLRMRYSWAF